MSKLTQLRSKFRRWLLHKLHAREPMDPRTASIMMRETRPQDDIEHRQQRYMMQYAPFSPEYMIMARLHKLAPHVAWGVRLSSDYEDHNTARIKFNFWIRGEVLCGELTSRIDFDEWYIYVLMNVRKVAGETIIPDVEDNNNEQT